MTMTLRFTIWILSSLLTVSVAWAETANERTLMSVQGINVTEQDLQQELLLVPPDQRDKILAESHVTKELIRRLYQNKNMSAAAEQLKLDQTAWFQARMVAERRIALAEALRQHTEQQIGTPDFTALAREHYALKRDEFQLPDQFKALHILKRVQCDCDRDRQRQATEQLLTRLRAGEDFATLAKTESEDTRSAARGGDLDRWLKSEDLVPPFVDALKKLQIGELSDVVETEYGFHIIKKLDYQPAHQQSFEEVQASIERTLKLNYVNDLLKKKAADYLPPLDAKFDDAALEGLLKKEGKSQ